VGDLQLTGMIFGSDFGFGLRGGPSIASGDRVPVVVRAAMAGRGQDVAQFADAGEDRGEQVDGTSGLITARSISTSFARSPGSSVTEYTFSYCSRPCRRSQESRASSGYRPRNSTGGISHFMAPSAVDPAAVALLSKCGSHDRHPQFLRTPGRSGNKASEGRVLPLQTPCLDPACDCDLHSYQGVGTRLLPSALARRVPAPAISGSSRSADSSW
jgi:hypothetical protein